MTLFAVGAPRPIVTILLRSRRGLAAAAGAASAPVTDRTPGDLSSFATWGEDLLRGHLSAVYADPTNQGGPLQLLLNVLLRLVAPDGTVWLGFAAAVNGGLVYLAMRRCAALQRRRSPAAGEREVVQRELLVAAAAVLWLAQGCLWSGHTAEACIPALWCTGMVCAQRGRPVCAGLCFGVGMGIAPWAVLATPAVLAVSRLRGAVLAAAAAVAVGVALYAPFVLSGTFHLLDYQWLVESHSLVALLVPVRAPLGWSGRALQALFVVSGTALIAVWLRRRPELAVVLAPIVASGLRIASDPKRLDYYWLPVEGLTVLAVVGAPMTGSRLGIERRTLLLAYVGWASVASGQVYVGGLIVALLVAIHACRPSLTASGRRPAAFAARCTAAASPAAIAPGRCP